MHFHKSSTVCSFTSVFFRAFHHLEMLNFHPIPSISFQHSLLSIAVLTLTVPSHVSLIDLLHIYMPMVMRGLILVFIMLLQWTEIWCSCLLYLDKYSSFIAETNPFENKLNEIMVALCLNVPLFEVLACSVIVLKQFL